MQIWNGSDEYCWRYRADTILSTDGQTDKVKPVYPPFNFVEAGGIKMHLNSVKIPINYLTTREILNHESKCIIGTRGFINLGCFTVLTVSRSPSPAHTYLPKLFHGPDFFGLNHLHIYWSRQPRVFWRVTSLLFIFFILFFLSYAAIG